MSLAFIAKQPIGAKYASKLNQADFSDFAKARLKTVKPQTLNGDMMAFRTILRYAKMVFGLQVSLSDFEEVMTGLRYARQIKPSAKRNRLPTTEELRRLTQYFANKESAYPMHLVIWLAIYTCRREGELTQLQLADFDGEWWLVRNSKNPKGSQGNHKYVKIPANALPIIAMLKSPAYRKQMQSCKYYDDKRLLPLDPKTISKSFTDACKILGITDLHFHDLRHEGATRLAEQGLTIPKMQQITGHSSWGSLQRYTNLKRRDKVIEFAELVD